MFFSLEIQLGLCTSSTHHCGLQVGERTQTGGCSDPDREAHIGQLLSPEDSVCIPLSHTLL